MSKGIWICSTLSNDQKITAWDKPPSSAGGRPANQKMSVVIKGKANIADPRTLVTSKGVLTKVTKEQLAFLQRQSSFVNFVKGGFMLVHQGGKPAEAQMAADMQARDKSAPTTPETAAAKNTTAKPNAKDVTSKISKDDTDDSDDKVAESHGKDDGTSDSDGPTVAQRINEALSKLDPEDDKHWTAAGLPEMAIVEELAGFESSDIKRKDVTEARPGFTRKAAKEESAK